MEHYRLGHDIPEFFPSLRGGARVPADGAVVRHSGSSDLEQNSSNDLTIRVVPPPTITALGPAAATAGGPAFTSTVTGSGFSSTSSVRWAGNPLPTTFVSATQLSATASADLIASPASVPITVLSNGMTSAPFSFTIGPRPVISSLAPVAAIAGGASFTLTVTAAISQPERPSDGMPRR